MYPSISYGTIYRNLNILVSTGDIRRIESSRDKDRFDGKTDFHAHFTCESCNILYDVSDMPENLIDDIEYKTGHQIIEQQINFYGLCASCAAKKQKT